MNSYRPRGSHLDRIEQAWARWNDAERIARELDVPLRDVLAVKKHMDAVVADERLRAELRQASRRSNA